MRGTEARGRGCCAVLADLGEASEATWMERIVVHERWDAAGQAWIAVFICMKKQNRVNVLVVWHFSAGCDWGF